MASFRRFIELTLVSVSSIRRTPLRLFLTSCGVAIAGGMLLSMVGFALGVQDRIEGPLLKYELLQRIDVTRTPRRGNLFGPRKQEEKEKDKDKPQIDLDDKLIEKLQQIPGVLAAYPQTYLSNVEVEKGDKKTKTSAFGIAVQVRDMRFVRDSLVAGHFPDKQDAAEVMLGTKVATNLGFENPKDAVGQTIKLTVSGLSPTEGTGFAAKRQTVELKVSGVWDPPSVPFFVGGGLNADSMVIPVDYAKTLPGAVTGSTLEQLQQIGDYKPGTYTRIIVRCRLMSEVPSVAKQITAMGLNATNILDRFAELRNSFLIMDFVLIAIGTVALIVSGLGIINTMLVAVLERVKEIGLLKAMGASNTDILVLYLTESAVIGVVGGIGGVVLGLFVSWNIQYWINRYAAKLQIEDAIVTFLFPMWLLVSSVAFTIFISMLSGLIPALRAAKVDPIRALRSE